jgi:hypothetical protein
MARPLSGLRRLVVVAIVLEVSSCFSLFVAGVDSPLVSRNKSHPQPPAASIPFPPFPCCRSFHPAISYPAGFEVDLRPSCLDQTPSWVDLLPTIVSRHLSSPAESPTVTATASPSQQSQILEPASSKRRPSLVPARSSCLPMGSRCKLLHLPPTTIQPHLQVVGALFRPWLHQPASTDAMRGLRLGVRVYDASAFPPPATPSTPSPWTPSSCSSWLPGLLCNLVFFGGLFCNTVAVII